MSMNLSNLTKIFFTCLLPFLLLSCNGDKDVSYQDTASIGRDSITAIPLKKEKEITLDSGDDIIGAVLDFDPVDDNFLIVDPIHAKQCYLFDGNGKLLKKIGQHGEGPGEYLYLLSACVSKDRIYLVGMVRVNIYEKDGTFIKTTQRPFRGLCNSMHAAPDGTVFALSFNRYNTNKDSIYQLDRDGELVKSFSPVEDVPPVFDTYFPQTGLCLDETGFYQFFNFKYELSFFDYEGKKRRDIKLSSPFYTPPVFKNATVKGHKAEKEYRATFTQVIGFFKHTRGYAALLTNWKNSKDSQDIFEFLDKDFKRVGYFELGEGEHPLGIYDDRIISATFEDETKIIYRKIVL